MADPSKYTQGYDFSNFADSNPTTPLPGDRLDNELANISASTDELRLAVMDIRRSDGALKNGIVTADSLSPSLTSVTGSWEGPWGSGTAYTVNQSVSNDGSSYICTVAHTSGASTEPGVGASWATYWDLTASKGGDGADGATWHSGSGAPADGTGANGDFYLDAAASAWYGPKSGGTWTGTGPNSLIGDAGADGNAVLSGAGAPSDGTGVNGDFYIDTSATAVYGPKAGGTWTGTGPVAMQGSNGTNGVAQGIQFAFSTTTTDSDPGAGVVRANNGTFASVTQLFFDNTNQSAANVTAWLDALDDVTNANSRGTLRLQKADDATVWMEFAVIGDVTDGTGYRKVPVDPIAGALPSDTDVMAVMFTPAGADGAGAVSSVNGQTGVVVLDPDDLDDTATTNKFTTAAEISKLAGIEAGAEVNNFAGSTGATDNRLLRADGTGGATLQASAITVDDSGNMSGVGTFNGYTPREVFTANRTYYVSTSGSDSNDGLTVGAPFATIQKAWGVLVTKDLNGFTATIKLADGTYTAGLNATVPVIGGSVIIDGNSSTPTNVLLGPTGSAIQVVCAANVTLKNFKLTSTIYGVESRFGGVVYSGTGMEYGTNTVDMWRADNGGYIGSAANFTISGGGQKGFEALRGGIIEVAGVTITLTGTPNYSNAFAKADGGTVYFWSPGTTWSGSATGKRYDAIGNGVVNSFGAATTWLPGSVAGTTSTGGQYV